VALYCRFQHGARVAYGLVEGDWLQPLSGDLFGDHAPSGDSLPLADVKLLAPIERPGKILAAAVNYQSHVPSGRTVLKDDNAPAVPQLFLKPSSSVVGPGDTIVLPAEARRVDAEGEVVAVIGRLCRNVSPEQALDYVFGYTCGNDVSERDWQNGPDKDMQWWRAKGADTFAPLGPAIVRGLEYGKLLLQTRLNGQVMQKQYTSDLLFDCPTVVSFVSQYVTLTPGDVIYTGTPGTTRRMNPGEVLEVEIEGIGVLRHRIVAE
jgi:2-keto-4-pentenoate hydratase/2-oxohepta-3-ene-1,7-dioic acid hydratase in catechol pathway